jgi:hypothetical protein
MSAHHDDHHSTEQKPVSFTVPFILAGVTLLILVSFLSLCDPKKGHQEEHSKDAKNHQHDMNRTEGSEKQAVESDEDPAPAEDVPVMEAQSTEKAAEPAAEEKH